MNGHSVRRPSGHKGTRWQGIVFVDAAHGGPRREVVGTFDLKREADDAWQDAVDAYRGGGCTKPSRLTVSQLVERWLSDAIEVDRAPTTVANYRSARWHSSRQHSDSIRAARSARRGFASPGLGSPYDHPGRGNGSLR